MMVWPTTLTLLGAVGCLLRAASASDYETHKSRFDPSNQIRVKRHIASAVCDGGVPSHSGWADMGPHHMFFWYYEARRPTPDTPVMIWLTGGPGGSSQTSALVENGDCYLSDASTTTTAPPERNPYGWTEEFHMIYLDQPAGVGLSYIDDPADIDAYPSTAEDAALDFVRFVRLFGQVFPDLADRPLHIAGESYGGRWAPVFADTVIQYNDLVPPDDRVPLASVIVVSGWTNPRLQIPAMYDVSCFPFKQYSAFLNGTVCAHIDAAYQQCEVMMRACDSTYDGLMCAEAGKYCKTNIMDLVVDQLVNKYDRRMVCSQPGRCYPVMTRMQDWMNSDAVFRDLLDVPGQSGGRKTDFVFMSRLTSDNFQRSGDFFMDSTRHLGRILSSTAVPVLYTAGNVDALVSPKGVGETLDSVIWPGRPAFKNAPWEDMGGTTGSEGRIRRTERLWLAEIEGAGHMAPRDQPRVMLSLMRQWIDHVHGESWLLPDSAQQVALDGEL